MKNIINTGNKLGRSIALFRLVIAVFVASSMSTSGVALLSRKPKYTSRVTGVYNSADCTKTRDKEGRIYYDCNLEYRYDVNGKSYEGILNGKNSPVKIKAGETVPVHYNPKDHADSTLNPLPGKTIGIGLISAGCCLVTVSLIVYQITRSFRGAGTLVAGAAAYNFLTD
jgi:hypothetical protein